MSPVANNGHFALLSGRLRSMHLPANPLKPKSSFSHRAYYVGVILKGINGALETIGGVILLCVPHATIGRTLLRLSEMGLSEQNDDILSVALYHAAQSFMSGSKLFAAFYLLSHGLVKAMLVYGLLKEKMWAFPAGMVFISAFVLYQSYRLIENFSYGMLLLTSLDAVVLVLIWREYRSVKKKSFF